MYYPEGMKARVSPVQSIEPLLWVAGDIIDRRLSLHDESVPTDTLGADQPCNVELRG